MLRGLHRNAAADFATALHLDGNCSYALGISSTAGCTVGIGRGSTKIAGNRETARLFDAKRFTRHLEAAYAAMWQRFERGERPSSFAIDPMP